MTTQLRYGWTTGACATAAAKAAYAALLSGHFEATSTITLPRGETVCFALAQYQLHTTHATAAIVKDAGDDPDVTHMALIEATVRHLPAGSGVCFKAGKGVGTITKPGLALAVGEPAINPVPRQMMQQAMAQVAAQHNTQPNVEIEIAIANGEALALKTLNPRLGILGGLSVLGTTGIVVPFSCAAWIHSIYRGIDIARAAQLPHIAGATGSTSELAVQQRYNLPDAALIDMGDFVGGMLKYLRRNPVPRVTIAGGFAKMTKLAQGLLDVHSRAGQVDFNFLATAAGNPQLRTANTAAHALELAGPHLATTIAQRAWQTAAAVIKDTDMALEVIIFDRAGQYLAHYAPLR